MPVEVPGFRVFISWAAKRGARIRSSPFKPAPQLLVVAKAFCWLSLLTGNGHPTFSQDRPAPASLAGLKGVCVQVDADRGLKPRMESRIEQELKKAGIRILAEKDWDLVPDIALLHLDVTVRCERDDLSCGYSVVLKVGQRVQVMRGQRPIVSATTWSNSYTASIRKTDLPTLPDVVAVDAGALILGFIHDFRIANP